MSLADYQTLVDSLVRDPDGNFTVGERDKAIDLARIRYSQDHPETAVEDITSVGGKLLDFPAAFQSGFSALTGIEIPAGEVPPRFIENGTWNIYHALDGQKILIEQTLTAGDLARVHFTVPHTLDGVADTIPAKHQEPVASWAAAVLLEQLATLFSGDTISTINADSVDHQSKSRDYSARATKNRKRYFDELGIDPKRNVAAGVVVNLDPPTSHGRPPMYRRGWR